MVRSANYQQNQPPQGQSDFLDHLANLLGELILKACVGVLILAWVAALFPMLSLPVAGSVALGWWLGWPYGVAAGVVTVTGWWLWRRCWPASFERWVTGRMRQKYFRWWRYSRRWSSLMALQRLTAELDTRVLTPPLLSVSIGPVIDVLQVGLVTGQTVETWEQRSEELRHSFRALGVRVLHTNPGRVRVEVLHTDILRKPIPLPRDPEDPIPVDLEMVTVGKTQIGLTWQLELLGTHILVGGATGAGKGSIAWSIIAGVGPAIAAGTVVVRGLDPKGGAEMGYGMGWFDRFAYDNSQGALELLRETAEVMLIRLARIRTRLDRKVYPSTDEPMILLIIDEAASLTEYYSDRKVKDEIERLLGLILTMGRAAGVVVVSFVQDPSKEVMRLRQLYPTRIVMRVAEPTQVGMVLGPTARDRGAQADLISPRTPGVGYVQITPGADLTDPDCNEAEESTAFIERVRAFNVTDDDIRWIIDTYTPPRRYSGDTVTGEPVVVDLDDYLSTRRNNDGDDGGNRKGRTG